VKIMPTMCKGIVLAHGDGKTFELAPLQVFIGATGQTIIRIGRNALFFDKNGNFDGTESHIAPMAPDSPELKLLHEAFEFQGKNKGLPPDQPYFRPGTPGHAAETRSWPAGKREDGGQMYLVKPQKLTSH